ncbi:DUF4192 domain-containing protein [Saccharopolyspora cebuensis]|uniref:DUF4192 domain-containing protein n=1 Tax=Saccharopolyspora cebuensis TaxID=418759 RepID=A0ABV4CHS0_9PSEU
MAARINTPIPVTSDAELLAAVPHLVGFAPADSLIVITVDDPGGAPSFGVTVRVDLPCPGGRGAVAEMLLRGPLRTQRTSAVFLVVVGHPPERDPCGETCCPPDEPGSPPNAVLVDHLVRRFRARGITVVQALWAPEIRAGAAYHGYLDGETGEVDDPLISPVGTAMATTGAVTFGSREELCSLVATEDPDAVQRRAARLDALTEEREDEAPGSELLHRDVNTVFGAIQRTATGAALTEEDVVRVLLALSDTRVRDTMLGTVLSEQAGAAEQLWLELVRKAPEPEVADAAALLAFAAYMRGEGGLASVALERIEQVRPDHRLGTLLRHAMDAGITPADLAIVARDAAEDARIMMDEEDAW